MLRKSILVTLDDITMSNPSSSVQEKVSKLESDSEKVRNILAGASTQPHVEANVEIINPGDTVENKTEDAEIEVNKETDKKSKPVDDTDDLNYDPKKFASMKDYEAYKLPSKINSFVFEQIAKKKKEPKRGRHCCRYRHKKWCSTGAVILKLKNNFSESFVKLLSLMGTHPFK